MEVCAKEYNFDIKLAMLLIGAGGGKEPKERKEKKERGKKPAASGIAKVVKDMVEGEVEGEGEGGEEVGETEDEKKERFISDIEKKISEI